MGFEWDRTKDEANQAKHLVSFRQAAEIFRDFHLAREDTRRDYGEVRMIALGEYDGEVLTVVFTRRGDVVRIISAWKASRHDRKIFYQARQDRQAR
jgi:uncharacterized protein